MLLLKIVDVFFQVYMVLLFARILLSWLPEYHDHKFVRFIAFYTDPYLNLFRRIIPPLGMFDFSPIIAFLSLGLLEQVVKALIKYFIR